MKEPSERARIKRAEWLYRGIRDVILSTMTTYGLPVEPLYRKIERGAKSQPPSGASTDSNMQGGSSEMSGLDLKMK